MLIDDLTINLNNTEKAKLFLCKPNLEKTIISRLSEAYNIRLNIKLGNVSELSFTLPFEIDNSSHEIVSNQNINKIKDRFIVKLVWGNYIEFFTIRIPNDNMDDEKDEKSFLCYSLQYELIDKQIKSYNVISYNATEVLVGNGVDKIGVLANTLWTVDYIDADFDLKYRSFEIPSSTVLDAVFNIATTFNAIVIWNTQTRKISLYKQENVGLNRGLKISYGKYLKALNREINSDDVCTRLKVYGKNGVSIQEVNTTGTNYIEDFSYFLYPFTRDESKNVLTHSDYMSDSLCNAWLDYLDLLETKEPISKTTETNTTITNIKINNHGLVVGDYIVNINRGNAIRKVLAVVDVNNFTVSSIANQTANDTIKCYKDGTFGKLLYQKEDKQTLKTTKENELSVLQTEMNVILDNLDVAQATGQSTTQLIADRDAKQIEINTKQNEIDQLNNDIIDINNQIANLQNTIKLENNLTANQLLELNQFIVEKEVTNEYIESTYELLDWAKKEFDKIKSPPIILKVNMVDLFKCLDKECQIDRDKIILAEIVTVFYEKMNINYQAKIIEINVDFESDEGLELVISNVQQILTDEEKFLKTINKSIGSSTIIDLEKFKWSKNVEDTSAISQLLNQAWDTTRQNIIAGTNNTVDISRRGIIIKDLTDPLSYLVAQNGVLAITNDGGNTWKHAITKNGIIGERIIGELIMGTTLIMTNQNADFRFDENGVTLKNTSLTITGGLPENQIDSTATTKWNSAEQNAKDYADNQLTNFVNTTYDSDISNLQSQIDGSITTWFYGYEPTLSNEPALSWISTTDKDNHLGDLFYNTITGYAYRFAYQNSVYQWIRITDTDITTALANAATAQDTADSKRRVFVTTPTPPYDVGDLWSGGSTGDLQRCKIARASGSFLASEWELASKYTDDTTANNAISLLSDISNDNKLTPVEKTNTKIQWDAIVVEKPTIESQATTYGITTEKTNYTNAYNTLSTYITPLLSDLSTTSDITGTTFRANFTDYYNKRTILLKTISEKAVIVGNAYNTVVINSADGVKASHTDGSFTQLSGAGLKRIVSGVDKPYFYLYTTARVSTVGTQLRYLPGTSSFYTTESQVLAIVPPITITLPPDYRNKDFKIFVDSRLNQRSIDVIKRHHWQPTIDGVNTWYRTDWVIEAYNIDKAAGTFQIKAYAWTQTGPDDYSPDYYELIDGLDVFYTVTA